MQKDVADVDVRLEVEPPPGAPSRMPSVEESELEGRLAENLAEDSWPAQPEISCTEQRTSATL